MRYYLSDKCALKWLEKPCVYNIKEDNLYELDDPAFDFLKRCASSDGCNGKTADHSFIEYCLSEGILTKERVDIKRPPLVKSPEPSLRYLELQITDKCNLRCSHCYIGQPKNQELDLNKIKNILDEFEYMQGLRLLITGGEPCMHSGFNEINEMLSGYSFRKILFTNGLLLKDDLIKRLNVDEIQFSIDGMEKGHEILRGKGTYKIVMEKLIKSIDFGITVSIATMVHRGNLDEFEAMENLFKKLGIKEWTVDVPCEVGNLKKDQSLMVSPEIGGKYLNFGFGTGLHSSEGGYGCGLNLVSVLANGNISKCAFYSDMPVGSIDEGLIKTWKKINPIKLEDLECNKINCRFIDLCRGGCRYRAEQSGNKGKKDLYKCHMYGIIKL